ncbi:hypothetical protein ACPEEZ_11015 [Frigoribacterium sp. 2-23]|uniref:hypothetical protein n=1 Tax=Frigoribacterium sp. 2-23 TaxID=3415006 RepID=UPI003C6EF892
MPIVDPSSVPLSFAATYDPESKEAQALRRAARAGRVVRVHRGVYVDARSWSSADARARHVILARAVMLGLGACVASHSTAVALHDLPALDLDVDRVCVIDARRSSTQTTKSIRRRPGPLDTVDVTTVSGVPVTSLDRTAVDIARTASFADAVMCVDAVLRREALPRGHRSGVLTDAAVETHRSRLLDRLGPLTTPGARAAHRALTFACPYAENGGESLARVVLFELGVVEAVPQREFVIDGVVYRGDFFLAEYGALLEFDGFAKYDDPQMRGGRTPAEVVRAEKRREARLLTHPEIRVIIRFEYRDLVDPRRLAALLQAAGIPVDPRRVTAAARAAARRFARGQ